MFPLHGLPFDLRSLTVKPELCSSNQSGSESLLVLARSRHWQLCTLLSLCLGARSLGTQYALTFFKFESLWIIAWIVAWPIVVHQLLCTCSPWWCRDMLHSCWHAGYWQVAWPGLIPSLTFSCPLLKVSTHCNAVLCLGAVSPHTHTHTHTYGCQPTMDVGSWLTFLPQEAYGPYLFMIFTFHCPRQCPLTDAVVPQERNLCHVPSFLSYSGCMINYPCSMTHTLLEWLGVSVEMLSTMSVNHLWTALTFPTSM